MENCTVCERETNLEICEECFFCFMFDGYDLDFDIQKIIKPGLVNMQGRKLKKQKVKNGKKRKFKKFI